jgi:hypothetical protein
MYSFYVLYQVFCPSNELLKVETLYIKRYIYIYVVVLFVYLHNNYMIGQRDV